MTLNIKNAFLFFILLFGIYIFYIEYLKIKKIKIDYTKGEFVNKDLEQNDEIIDISNFKNTEENIEKKEDLKLNKVEISISKGDTLFSILKRYNLSNNNIFLIVDKIDDYFDIKKLKINDKLHFYLDVEENVRKIMMYIDIDTQLIINVNNSLNTEIKKLKKDFNQISYEFEIKESLYSDGLNNNIPESILIKLIKLFSFDLDFQRDIKKNTLVSISYEFNQIKENNKIEYKDINYALISIDGKKLEYFKFLTDDGYVDYFNREGKNVKKSILKTPLDGARLSSNFGMRKHPISGYNKMHKGVDFAAPSGTPIYAGGNGVIEFAGNNGGYGKYIRIRHNNEYKTAYAHLSGFKKGISKGVRVTQGDIIGYVGSTGNSTGPHLHYEILFQGEQINPLKLKLPSGKILKGEELKRFNREYKTIYANHLNLLYE